MAAGGLGNVPSIAAAAILLKCGEHGHLLVEACIASPDFALNSTFPKPASPNGGWLLDPFLRALQDEYMPQHSCCSLPLKLLSVHISGSTLARINVPGASDVDFMHEYGPVEWICQTNSVQRLTPTTHQNSGLVQPAMQLRLLDTLNAGFYILMRQPGPDCRHGQGHDGCVPLSAEDIRQLTGRMNKFRSGRPGQVQTFSGPARTESSDGIDYDHVPCLKLSYWPNKEVFDRLTCLEWLPASALQDIERGGLHVVPVGCQGSPTEKSEWRISFSRPEAITIIHMTPVMKRLMTTLKICKHELQDKGKAVKSYYFLTALFWLCMEFPLRKWTSVMHGAGLVLGRLQQAIDTRHLPCFFMASINVIQSVTEEGWAELSRAVSLMQQQMLPLMVGHVCRKAAPFLLPLLKSENVLMSENQLRRCLVRTIIASNHGSLICHAIYSTSLALQSVRCKLDIDGVWWTQVPRVCARLNFAFIAALAMAPAEVAGRVRLSRTSDGTWSWDVAPLAELLTDDDLDNALFGDREAVFRWCDDQNALPAAMRVVGVPADPRSLPGLIQLLTNPATIVAFLHSTNHRAFVYIDEMAQKTARGIDINRLSFENARNAALARSPRLYSTVQQILGKDVRATARFVDRLLAYTESMWMDGTTRAKYSLLRSIRSEDPWGLGRYLNVMR